ncbi:MAG: phosphoglycerate mutase, partial [Desulfonatronovibrio sp.]
VTQRAGRLKKVLSFHEKFGLKGASISSGAIYAGLCKYLGIRHVKGRENHDHGEEIRFRVEQAQDLFGTHDFIHVHSKAPDEAGHAKDPVLKKQAIEQLDKGLALSLPEILKREDVVLAITADHSTPCSGVMVHSGEPVPMCILGPGVRKDHVLKFDEVSAGAGGLGFVHGPEFMYMVLNYLDRGKLVGLMDTPEDQPYWPGQSKPLRIN